MPLPAKMTSSAVDQDKADAPEKLPTAEDSLLKLESSLPPSVRQSLLEIRKDWISETGRGSILIEYRIEVQVSRHDLEMAQKKIEAALLPLPHDTCTKRLGKLRFLTVSRATGQVDTTLSLAAYAERLAEYPAWCVLRALTDWPDQSKFWPSWCELKAELDRLARPRRCMKDAIEKAIKRIDSQAQRGVLNGEGSQPRKPAASQDQSSETDAERAAHAAEMMALLRNATEAMRMPKADAPCNSVG